MKPEPPWLLLDVGNTAIKWRLTHAECLLTPGGAVSDADALLRVVEDQPWLAVGISSVAGERAHHAVIEALGFRQGAPVRVAVSESSSMGVRNSYAVPEEMGVDRWLAMLAAHCLHEGPVCVIDAGTAITLDLLTTDGEHLGGYILPGADLMSRALTNATGRINAVLLDLPTLAPGNSTAHCVSAGAWRSALGAVQSVLADFPDHRPLLTGGGADALIELGLAAETNPDLVFEGLRLWLSQKLDDEAH
jgi:type III pantothenate kinase